MSQNAIIRINNQRSHIFSDFNWPELHRFSQMASIIFLVTLVFCLVGCDYESKEESVHPYGENIDYDKEITSALQNLKNKQRLMLVFGANWCPSCRRLDASLNQPDISIYLKEHFKIIKVNIGNFDKNLNIADRYKLPIKQGIPAIVIINRDETVSVYIKTRELSILHKKGRKVLFQHLKNI